LIRQILCDAEWLLYTSFDFACLKQTIERKRFILKTRSLVLRVEVRNVGWSIRSWAVHAHVSFIVIVSGFDLPLLLLYTCDRLLLLGPLPAGTSVLGYGGINCL
jgi:hypothetical protein